MKDAGDGANNNPSFKLSFPTRQDIVNWVHRWYVFLQESKAMIQHYFEVRGITSKESGLVCNYDFKFPPSLDSFAQENYLNEL